MNSDNRDSDNRCHIDWNLNTPDINRHSHNMD